MIPSSLIPHNLSFRSVACAASRATVCILGLNLLACQSHTGAQLRLQYSRNTNCPLESVTVDHVAGERYVATGCDSAAFYRCNASGCEVDSSDSDSDSPGSSGKSSKTVLLVPVDRRSFSNDSAPLLEKTKSGKTNVVLNIVLENLVSLRLSALAQEQTDGVHLRLAEVASEQSLVNCDLELMLNGQKVTTSATKRTRKGSITALNVELPPTVVSELGTVRQMALRACDKRFTLSERQLTKVQQFASKYHEEVAWNGDPKSGTTGGLMAPASGWPEWKVSSTAPAVNGGPELRGEELFQLLAPSVLRVEGLSGGMVSQGSAVVVSPREILTNCHVVSGAQKILARNGKQEWVARLLRADPATDRCVLTIDDTKLTPVKGVRTHAELKVGEPLYTLGAPSGLELSLSDGVLAGLREDNGRHFVQTTAPISPGSSGGGLFDRRGNLVGITTLVLVGRQGYNQSLNFAIPAEAFFRQEP